MSLDSVTLTCLLCGQHGDLVALQRHALEAHYRELGYTSTPDYGLHATAERHRVGASCYEFSLRGVRWLRAEGVRP